MLQLTQKLKNGAMQVLDVPVPALQTGCVLVRNHYSLISAGTETSTVKAARTGYIGKAKERPQQVKQVLETLMTLGPAQTYRAVMKKLDAYSPLGYSCVGEVIDVSANVTDFRVGDLVACGGLSASHAEAVSVPKNLCVKLKPDTDLKLAAYNTLGAIAMQGVRQADLRLGETCAVIGLGLLGQLTALILGASGVRIIGIDIDAAMVGIASKHCLDLALKRDDDSIAGKINDITAGVGCDAVIITAGTGSLDPINFAGQISRKRGTVVIVGAVPAGFNRDPYYYRKELQVKMSCSYGPGRYDPVYEDKGIDYPAAYVRWTENRNMQAFQELLHSRKIDPGYLTTHTFRLADAPSAYDMLLSKSEPFIGVLIEYDPEKALGGSSRVALKPGSSPGKPARLSIGFIGAGSYAQSHLLPKIPKDDNALLKGVMTATGTGARSVGERFGFEFCTTNEEEILENEHINTVFIATRHDTHARYVMNSLRAGKNVFVEKPLCLTETELEEIDHIYQSPVTSHQSPPLLMVGFNRRFSPLTELLKEKIGSGPMAMIYRINAGAIPPDSWIQDKDIGGGRIIGEVCHFVDLLTHINGSLPERVFATALPDPTGLQDTLAVNLSFRNGSIGTISYYANGSKSLTKEYVEIYHAGTTVILKDFMELEIYGGGRPCRKKLLSQDKGQVKMVRAFVDAIKEGKRAPIDYEEIHAATMATFKIIESLRSGNSVRLETSL